jgi:3-hydroxyacyl-[acyl-carrier-protein] dehydratase
MSDTMQLDIQEILRRLPHRYPFLLVDRVLEWRRNESIRALKNVTVNEPFFTGHFPERPVMPGVIIIEALAQAAGVLLFVSAGAVPDTSMRLYFAGIDKARFRKPVLPGDQLILTARLGRNKRGIWRVGATGFVGEDVVCEADMLLVLDLGDAAAGKVPE